MAGLDLGTLAGYHRHDLAREMRKSRITGTDRAPAAHAGDHARRQRLLTGLRTMIEIATVRLRRRQALQRGG